MDTFLFTGGPKIRLEGPNYDIALHNSSYWRIRGWIPNLKLNLSFFFGSNFNVSTPAKALHKRTKVFHSRGGLFGHRKRPRTTATICVCKRGGVMISTDFIYLCYYLHCSMPLTDGVLPLCAYCLHSVCGVSNLHLKSKVCCVV